MIYYPCPRCGRKLLKKPSAEGYYWGCSNYPRCKKFLSEKDGKPYYRSTIDYHCSSCKIGNLIRIKKYDRISEYIVKKHYFWLCDNTIACGKTFKNIKNKPSSIQIKCPAYTIIYSSVKLR